MYIIHIHVYAHMFCDVLCQNFMQDSLFGGKSIVDDMQYIHIHVRMWSTLPLGGSGSILPHVHIIIHVGPLGYFWGPRSLVAE